jgi:fluoroacetyl-CoA thioesterase
MQPTLVPGISREVSLVVTRDMSPPHLPRVVLSTPTMIEHIEGTCLQAAQEHLDPTETTVGTHVCVSHTGGAYEGETFTVRVRLAKIEKRRLTFETEVLSPRGPISTGTHERAVIDTARFAAG